jgi:hypothetical protein
MIPFSDFWKIYPRKDGKAMAEKKWQKLKINEETFKLIERHLKTFAGKEKQYIPMGSTYVNQQRWRDIEDVEDDTPYTKFLELYNEVCTNLYPVYSTDVISQDRRDAIDTIWRLYQDHQNSDFYAEYFAKANQDVFLNGQGNGYKADFNYIIKPETFERVMEH